MSALMPREAAALAADVAWLTAESMTRTMSFTVPDTFSVPAQEFARLALTSQKMLWSCHYGIDRFSPTLWVLARRDCFPALIVCPPACIPAWKSAWTDSMLTLPSGRQVTVAEYGTRRWRRGVDVTVLTYDRLKKKDERALAELVKDVRAVVLDESHWAREETTLRHHAVAQLTEMLPPGTPILALTTQPVANRIRELCVQLRLIGADDSPLLDPARLRLLLATSPDGVARKLAQLGLVIHHGENAVAEYMPPLKRRLTPVQLSTASRKEVRSLQREFEQFLITGQMTTPLELPPSRSRHLASAKGALVLRTNSELSTLLLKAPPLEGVDKFSAALLLDQIRMETARGKVNAALAFIRKHMEESPVIVLVEQRRLGDTLAKALKVPFLHGSMKQGHRRQICEKFQDGELSVVVLSMGLQNLPPLTRAGIVVIVDLPWNQAFIDRALRCVYRPGVNHDITVYVLTDDEHGLEGFIRRLHAFKVVVAEAVLRGIDPADEQLVSALQDGLALEAAGLHPDDWFKQGYLGLEAQAVRRLPNTSDPAVTTKTSNIKPRSGMSAARGSRAQGAAALGRREGARTSDSTRR